MLRAEVRVKKRIDAHWSDWFEGFDLTHTDQNETILNGDVADQPALYGPIAKLRDLNLPLTSVNSAKIESEN